MQLKTGAVCAAAGLARGGGEAVENRQPYVAVITCIALVGTYPSRN